MLKLDKTTSVLRVFRYETLFFCVWCDGVY